MDVDSLEKLLASIERNEKTLFARDVIEASPLAQEILNARPYAFLDDAPLEERRTRAVFQRRWLDPETAKDMGKLDQGAIDRVRDEAWPRVENADELHDALVELGFITERKARIGTGSLQNCKMIAARPRFKLVLRVRTHWKAAKRRGAVARTSSNDPREPGRGAAPRGPTEEGSKGRNACPMIS